MNIADLNMKLATVESECVRWDHDGYPTVEVVANRGDRQYTVVDVKTDPRTNKVYLFVQEV
jgi:hypothetical protein